MGVRVRVRVGVSHKTKYKTMPRQLQYDGHKVHHTMFFCVLLKHCSTFPIGSSALSSCLTTSLPAVDLGSVLHTIVGDLVLPAFHDRINIITYRLAY